MWLFEALMEEGVTRAKAERLCYSYERSFAIYPKRFYKETERLRKEKEINYCFIGTLMVDPETQRNREWIIEFAKKKMDTGSYLQITDAVARNSHKPLGKFDHTLTRQSLVPKELPLDQRSRFDAHYFKTMALSKFCLCPAGDSHWSMRFYEALMCKCIPIVKDRIDTYRSKEEAQLAYKYYTHNEEHIYKDDWADENYKLFLERHTFEHGLPDALTEASPSRD